MEGKKKWEVDHDIFELVPTCSLFPKTVVAEDHKFDDERNKHPCQGQACPPWMKVDKC